MSAIAKVLRGGLAGTVLAFAAHAADAATYNYVGSWAVDDGPVWPEGPIAYSGKSAAAFLFGGAASQYVISTIDNLVANIDFQAWVSTWGGGCSGTFPCGTKVADDFVQSTGGNYLTPGDTSAYVRDWAVGPEYTNYAFQVAAVPLPAGFPLLALALVGTGIVGARRKKQSV